MTLLLKNSLLLCFGSNNVGMIAVCPNSRSECFLSLKPLRTWLDQAGSHYSTSKEVGSSRGSQGWKALREDGGGKSQIPRIRRSEKRSCLFVFALRRKLFDHVVESLGYDNRRQEL